MALPRMSAQKHSCNCGKRKGKKNTTNKKRRPAPMLKGRRSKK